MWCTLCDQRAERVDRLLRHVEFGCELAVHDVPLSRRSS
jgi:hypothetical protein